jgi:hypothetical protein
MGGFANHHRMSAMVTALISVPMYMAACNSGGDTPSDGEAVAQIHQAVATPSGGGCATDPRVMLGLVSLEVCAGADLFFGEAFGGNGRTCATCHPVAHNFTIDAAYIATLPDTDPLFVAELTPALAGLEIPALMRQYGLILENVDGADSPTSKFVMRSVPHTFALATSVTAQATPTDGTTRPPNERTGWSGDGAPNAGELRDFQTGAVMQHYTKSLARTSGTDFVLPTSAELDSIVAYLRSVGRTSELTLSSVSLSDPRADVHHARQALQWLPQQRRCQRRRRVQSQLRHWRRAGPDRRSEYRGDPVRRRVRWAGSGRVQP